MLRNSWVHQEDRFTRSVSKHEKHTYKAAWTKCLPDDEPTRVQTCRRRQKSNLKNELEKCASCWFMLHNCVTVQGVKTNAKHNSFTTQRF